MCRSKPRKDVCLHSQQGEYPVSYKYLIPGTFHKAHCPSCNKYCSVYFITKIQINVVTYSSPIVTIKTTILQPLRRHAVQVQASATVAAATTHETPLRVMIAGAPAAGKGTQCARIVEKYGLFHISVGDLLRAEVTAETPAGKRAKAFMDAGDLVPNDVVVEMVKVSGFCILS